MPFNSNERLQEALSLALEDRSRGYQDLISKPNVTLALMRSRGMFRPFSGPTIRERVKYGESGTYVRYTGYQFLNPKPAELFGDAEWTPKQAAVSVTLAGTDILLNSGRNQLMDIMSEHIEAAEQELQDRFNEDLHGDGTADGGLQISGFKMALPTVVTSGVYGGIDRATTPIWRPKSFDIQTDFPGLTQMSASNVFSIYSKVVGQLYKGNRSPTFALASPEHYAFVEQALTAIQRVTAQDNEVGRLGFPNYEFIVGGKRLPFVLEGGQGSAMPANTTYFIDVNSFRFRYHPERNFDRIGGKQMPINQDAVVQHIGFMGELTMTNPQQNGKLYDSNPSA